MIDDEHLARLVALHALETAKHIANTASPFLVSRLLGQKHLKLNREQLTNIQGLAGGIIARAMALKEDPLPEDWRRVLLEMAGDFSADQWAQKIGLSSASVMRHCERLGVAPAPVVA